MKTILNLINTPVMAALTLAGFLALASYAQHHAPQDGAYTRSDVRALDQLVGHLNHLTHLNHLNRSKSTPLKQRQAAALMDVYNLTDADIAAPVVLWRGK